MDEQEVKNAVDKMMMEKISGPSLRDQFAMAALTGIMARDAYDPGQATPKQRAALAYLEADAMLAARQKERK